MYTIFDKKAKIVLLVASCLLLSAVCFITIFGIMGANRDNKLSIFIIFSSLFLLIPMTLGILYLLHNYIFKPIKSLHIYIKAFLDGNTAAMKYQSQKHQDKSDTKMVVLHFKTEAQALEWLQEMGI